MMAATRSRGPSSRSGEAEGDQVADATPVNADVLESNGDTDTTDSASAVKSGAASEGVAAASVASAATEAEEGDTDAAEEEDSDILLQQAGSVLVDILALKNQTIASNP